MSANDAFLVEEELEIHPVALIMPPMNPQEFEDFKADIEGNGLLDPIVLFQGKVIDGRNRYHACMDLGIEVWARQWEGGMDPVEYVVSKNIHRRQLTPGQKAMAAAKAMSYHEEQAKERQRAAGGDKKSEDYQKSVVPTRVQPIEQDQSQAQEHEPIQAVAPVEAPATRKEPELKMVDAPKPQSKVETATERKALSKAGKMFDVSRNSVQRAKYIAEHGTEEEKKAVSTGAAPLAPIEKQVRERVQNTEKPAEKHQFNKTNESIDWAQWSWNPTTGCHHGCSYCYARDIAKRFPNAFPKGFDHHFRPERLTAPHDTKVPKSDDPGARNVFVCSMADLFGEWVPQEEIDAVLDACRNSPQWNYIFLTKNPARLVDQKWPRNAWVGTTVDEQKRVGPAMDAMAKLRESKYTPTATFLSCEPFLTELTFPEGALANVDWVIIGAMKDGFQPQPEWVLKLQWQAYSCGCKIYDKPNLKTRFKQYPIAVLGEEEKQAGLM